MSELLVFSILAVALAVYSALPEHRQLRRKFVVERWQYITAASLGLGIILLALVETYVQAANPQFAFLCGLICLPVEVWIQAAQAGAALVGISVVGYPFVQQNAQIGNDRALARLLRALYSRKEFATLSSLISELYETLLVEGSSAPQSSSTVEGLVTDDRFLDHFDELDPELAGKILRDNGSAVDRQEFTLRYFKRQLSDQTSLLYYEIEQAQEGGGRYRPEESTVLLWSLFSDCSVAQDVAIWNPVREVVREHIRSVSASTPNQYASSNLTSNRPEELYRDCTYVGIRFFDLMASAALTQQSQHHMWMHYLGHIAETLVEEFELADDANPSDEFPNDYARLLYEIHATLNQLVRNAASQNFRGRKAISDPGVFDENDLLKFSLRALLRCHRAILLSSDIPNRFKRERTHSIYELYEELDISNAQKSDLYAEALLQYMSSIDPRNPVGGKGQLEYLEETSQHLRTYDTAKLMTGGREQFDEMNKRISQTIGLLRAFGRP